MAATVSESETESVRKSKVKGRVCATAVSQPRASRDVQATPSRTDFSQCQTLDREKCFISARI